jgi:hypothetical protein
LTVARRKLDIEAKRKEFIRQVESSGTPLTNSFQTFEDMQRAMMSKSSQSQSRVRKCGDGKFLTFSEQIRREQQPDIS